MSRFTSIDKPLVTRPLGKNGPQVPRLGLGLMSLSGAFGSPASDKERLAFLDEAYKMGERFWDTSDAYGDSEDLIGKWIAANPEKRSGIFLATKFGIKARKFPGMVVDTTPEYYRQSLAKSLSRLQTSYVDLFYIHRLDKGTPIEKTIHSMVELGEGGKIKHLGISECSADSLRHAHAIHPITAVQMEYSPFCLSIESSDARLLEIARELGVAIVAYSPLAKGFLSGAILAREDLAKPGDSRSILPWFSEDNWPKNIAIVKRLAGMAEEKGVTVAQFTLAWVLAQGDDVFAIPGTAKLSRLVENLGALSVPMSSEEEKIVRKLSQGIVGARMHDLTGFTFVDTPLL